MKDEKSPEGAGLRRAGSVSDRSSLATGVLWRAGSVSDRRGKPPGAYAPGSPSRNIQFLTHLRDAPKSIRPQAGADDFDGELGAVADVAVLVGLRGVDQRGEAAR